MSNHSFIDSFRSCLTKKQIWEVVWHRTQQETETKLKFTVEIKLQSNISFSRILESILKYTSKLYLKKYKRPLTKNIKTPQRPNVVTDKYKVCECTRACRSTQTQEPSQYTKTKFICSALTLTVSSVLLKVKNVSSRRREGRKTRLNGRPLLFLPPGCL